MVTPILLIGDTIYNRTFRVTPRTGEIPSVPFTYLNEEWLEQVGEVNLTPQGTGYIALQLANLGLRPVMLSGLGTTMETEALRRCVKAVCDSKLSRFDVDGDNPIVTRILRKTTAVRVVGDQSAFRPQLRFDTPPSRPAQVDPHIEPAARAAAGGWALIRATTRDFFAAEVQGEERPLDASERAARRIDRIQRVLRGERIRMILDVRPLPRGPWVVDPEAIVCTTIGRLVDRAPGHPFRANPTHETAVSLVEETFWALSPTRALVCFAPNPGTIVVERAGGFATAQVHIIPVDQRALDPDGCGTVVGGDAFVAALLGALAGGRTVVEGAREATAAFEIAMSQRIGSTVVVSACAPRPSPSDVRLVTNGDLDRLGRVLKSLENGSDPCPLVEGVVAPVGGKLHAELQRLREALRTWRPRKGKDLIVIFGESRSGKEYPIQRLLANDGFQAVGPVNMYQFLAEVDGCLGKLTDLSDKVPAAKRALLIDEVTPGDSARSLLNLTGEKKYEPYHQRHPPIDFAAHPVIIMSSMDPRAMLGDLRGRRYAEITIPPLRDRWDEIPYLVSIALRRVLPPVERADVDLRGLRLSFDLVTALLRHDYLPVPNAPEGAGLDQRNFRAFDDLLEFVYQAARRSASAATSDVLDLTAAHLPEQLRTLATAAECARGYLRYTAGAIRPTVEPSE